ncbi:MAG: UvrD-helicase domain-containing protein [Gammaproteobacteria bacterium]|nr:UvrD-helicase domain-containing protein [Gammaproteobacteria bacterium]
MLTNTTLNPAQQQAVEHIGSPLLVLAGAGSGKTRVITHKIAHLIYRHRIAGHHIAAITFTNKAAREMKQRIGRMLKGDRAGGLTVCTFHSLGLLLLRSESHRLGYRPGFSIFDTQDSETLLRELSHQDSQQDLDLAELRQRISHWKNGLQSPEQVLADAKDEQQLLQAHFYAHYQRQLQAYNALDFDDLIVQPVRLFEQHPQVREHWQNRLRHLLVDEYQDTNASQYTLLKQLAGLNNGLTAVGDDDQSIYAWRGARPENISLLSKDFPNLKVIKLEQNYRSTNRILQSANHLISNNTHLFTKQLWSGQGLGDQLRVMPCKGPEHEARRIAGDILKMRFRLGDEYRNYAILYRGNHQSRPLEQALREYRIPYKVSGGTSFFESAEIKDIIAYLRLLANPEDDPAFLRIINTPRRGIGASTLEKLGLHANQRHSNLFTAARELGFLNQLPENARRRMEWFTDWLQGKKQQCTQTDPNLLVHDLVADIHYREWLLESCNNRKTAQKRIDNVNELLAWITRLASDQDPADGIDQLLSQLSLMDIIERNSSDQSADAVQLMTLHAAKGLEFSQVWVAGMEEGLLPHHSHLDTGQLEEERRLAYVGITRAKRQLTLSYAVQRSRYGESVDCEPSRFIKEIPKQHVTWEDGKSDPASPEARQAGKAHLSNLRALLND